MNVDRLSIVIRQDGTDKEANQMPIFHPGAASSHQSLILRLLSGRNGVLGDEEHCAARSDEIIVMNTVEPSECGSANSRCTVNITSVADSSGAFFRVLALQTVRWQTLDGRPNLIGNHQENIGGRSENAYF